MNDQLDVFVGGVLVGHLHNTHPLSFSYAEDCLNGLIGVPFAEIIPLQPGRIATGEVTAFFENLLPEGEQRSLLTASRHVSTTFGLLSEVGGDTAGSIVILPAGDTPKADEYLKVDWDDIKQSIHSGTQKSDAGILISTVNHVSISGAQSKMLLSLDQDGQPMIPLGASISTHILKPDITHSRLKVWSSAINETLLMKASTLCGLPTAEVAYRQDVRACLVKRYDRINDADGRVTRIYQADLCQLMGKPSTVKYESDGGPSFQDCYEMVKRKSVMPVIDCDNLLRWLFFNLYTGNNDSHAKNLSMLNSDTTNRSQAANAPSRAYTGLRLAPFYDLMCTRVYAGLSNDFAFKIGDHFKVGEISREDINLLASKLKVSEKYLLEIAADMAGKVATAIPEAASSLNQGLEYGERVLVERMTHAILSITDKMHSRLLDPDVELSPDIDLAAKYP